MHFVLTKEEVMQIKEECKTGSFGFFDLYEFAEKVVEANELKYCYQSPEGIKKLLEGPSK